MKYENIVVQLALHVIHSNVECYSVMCRDEELKLNVDDLKQFGADTETINVILKEMSKDVALKVQELQPYIAEIAFNFYQNQVCDNK